MRVSRVGRSVEYLAQSGVIASILKQQREEAQGTGSSVSCCGLKECPPSVAHLIYFRFGPWMSSVAFVRF